MIRLNRIGWATWGLAAIAGLVAAGAGLFWAGGRPARPTVQSDLLGPPHEIIPGGQVYYLGSDKSYGNTAAYAVRTSQGIIVIDPGHRFGALEEAFERLELDLSDVEILLITHRHADHWFCARELMAKTGAKAMAHYKEVPWLTRAADPRQYYSVYAAPIREAPTLGQVSPLRDGEVIRLGDTRIEVIAAPGHTEGSACFLAEIEGYRVLWSGDTLAALDPQAIDGDYMTRLGPQYGGDATAYLATLKRLNRTKVDILLPGHPLMGSQANPLIGRENWQGFVGPKIARLELRLGRYNKQMHTFLDGVARPLTEHVYYLGEVESTASYVFKTSEGLICTDPGHRDADAMRRQFDELGLDLDALKLVLLTGIHPDHAAMARALCDATGAALYCGVLAGRDDLRELIRPDHQVSYMDRLELGELRIRVLTAPGDAGADLCYLVQTPDQLCVVGGDSVGRAAKPPGGYHRGADDVTLPMTSRVPESILFAMRQKVTMVLPAHPQCDESPFFLPGEWEAHHRKP